jgi:hypothetical protein
VNPPYEATLNTALNKLTNEIFIFLLAYLMLLIGLSVFGSSLVAELRTLLYIIPILGVMAYVRLRRRNLSQKEHRYNVQVRSGIAAEESYVGGERDPTQGGPGRTRVTSLFARRSTVIGRDVGGQTGGSTEASPAVNAQYLLNIFQQLDQANQRRLISSAQSLLDKKQSPNA